MGLSENMGKPPKPMVHHFIIISLANLVETLWNCIMVPKLGGLPNIFRHTQGSEHLTPGNLTVCYPKIATWQFAIENRNLTVCYPKIIYKLAVFRGKVSTYQRVHIRNAEQTMPIKGKDICAAMPWLAQKLTWLWHLKMHWAHVPNLITFHHFYPLSSIN